MIGCEEHLQNDHILFWVGHKTLTQSINRTAVVKGIVLAFETAVYLHIIEVYYEMFIVVSFSFQIVQLLGS